MTVKCVNLLVLRIQCTFRWVATFVLQPQIWFRAISIDYIRQSGGLGPPLSLGSGT